MVRFSFFESLCGYYLQVESPQISLKQQRLKDILRLRAPYLCLLLKGICISKSASYSEIYEDVIIMSTSPYAFSATQKAPHLYLFRLKRVIRLTLEHLQLRVIIRFSLLKYMYALPERWWCVCVGLSIVHSNMLCNGEVDGDPSIVQPQFKTTL